MKKIILFLFALLAMVSSTNAQRAWAYGLGLSSEGDAYTFTFKATTTADATLVLYQEGVEVGTVALGAARAGNNTFTLTKDMLPGEGELNWAVRLIGEAIAEAVEVTSDEDKYYYYLAQDIATNTNPESKHFGKIYVLETYPGAGGGLSAHSRTQKKGIYVYDPALNLENYGEGYLPENVTASYATGKQYRDLHRIAVNPVNGDVAFVQSYVEKLWVASPENLNAAATNMIAGTGIKASSLCYDAEGTLYMLDPFADIATIYKMVDGAPVKFAERANWGWTDDRNSIVSDGRGGLWVVQNITNLTTNSNSEDMLTHINANGVVDLSVNKDASAELIALMPAKSNRGHVAYDTKNNVLAIGGNASVTLYNVTYTENGPELTKWMVVALGGNNVDGLAFDYAGDLLAMSASVERFYKFALPTTNNTCTTPAPKAQIIVLDEAIVQNTRAWAYGLKMTEDADKYTFYFTTTSNGDITILFKDKDGNELKSHSLGTFEAGAQSVELPKTDFADIKKDAYWSVRVDGEEITELAEMTADNDAYRFYLPQGVVVDNNTDSETFGQIFVAQATNGSDDDGMTDRTKAQKRGIFLFDQTLTSLNPTDNEGILPNNVTLSDASRQAMHRIAVNPVNNHVAFAYNVSGSPAVWSVPADNLDGEAINLIEGTDAIKMPNSICFDENGALYVMDNANATTGGTIYKVVKGVAEVFGAQNTTWANIDNALASDGRGGLWFLQYRSKLDGYNLLTHLNAEGGIDFAVNVTTPNGFVSQSSYRGAMAYNPREDMLAIGIGPDGQIGVSLYKVTYDETTGVPTVEFFAKTSAIGANVDALGFDYAGDLYVVSAAVERFYKFVVPTEENICEVPAAKNQAIKLGAQCTVTVLVNEEAMGVVSGAGDYEVGATVTLTASAAPEHRFLRWTKDDVEVSTEEIYSFVAEENVTLVAHFEAISKYNISAGANDGAMGTVTGGGEYLEGESVELSATAKSGYVFVEWNDGEKSATRTITVTEDATYTAIFQAIEARAWAYALNMEEDGEDYVFSFTATATANATLHFEYIDGTYMMSHSVGQVTAGPVSPITIAKSEFAGTKDVRWSVELDGNEITELAKLTDDSKYNGFWFAYGVGVNNCPESPYFGNIYVSNPRHSSKPNETGFYKYSPELVLDETIFEAGAKVGYKPANVTLANAVDAIQRMAVSPVDGTVAFVQWNSAPFAAYGMNPANLAGDAVNLTEGINQPVALCYDHEGSLCVLSYDGKSEGVSVYGIHIIKNGEKTTFFSQAGWVAGGYCEIASDGQGGFYVMSGNLNTSNVVTSAKLQHISKNAQIDLTVLPGGADLEAAPSTFNRLRLAYDLKHDVFALVGDKKVNLYNATYDAETGAPTLTKWISTPEIGNTVDGVAFDYAGDLYAVSAYTETFYKFVLPTVENVCIVPAADTIIVDKPKYIRAVAEGNYGTICLPKASSNFTGAEFYEVSSLVVGEGLWLDQLADGAQLVAGKPYIFQATANEITVTYTGEAVGAPVAGANGLTGTFTDIAADGVLVNNYIIAENQVWVAGTGATLSANRAYIDASLVPTTAQAQMPGRRRVIMGAEDEGTSTGFENITTTDKAVKIIENGQLIIIRNGEKFNAQGVKF